MLQSQNRNQRRKRMPFTSEEIKNLTRIALDQPPVWPEKKKLDGFRFTILLLEGELTYSSPYMTLEGEIDWGDGTIETVTIQRSSRTHTYSSLGPFQIIVRGNLTEFAAVQNYRMISVDTPFPKTMSQFTASSWFMSNFGIFVNCENLVSIPERLFSECTALTTAKDCFNNCKSLQVIPKEVFMNCYYITTFEGCFRNCTSLRTISENIFQNCWYAEKFKNCFNNCTSLTTIPSTLFYYLPQEYAAYRMANDFEQCFYGCKSLTTIPDNLFAALYYAETFKSCFQNCTSLSAVPSGLFNYCNANESFESCFNNCTSILTVAQNIFSNCRSVLSYKSCFSNCTHLNNIDGLFVSASNATDFSYCFYGCGVTEIPSRLFYNCDSAENFSYCFAYCKNLTKLENEWYHQRTNNTVLDFSYCFYYCQSIKRISVNLFHSCTAVTNFSHCFDHAFDTYDGCSIGIDAALFIGCSSAEDFSYCFAGCRIPSVYVGLFSGCISAKNFSHCFDGDLGYANSLGMLQDLFNDCSIAEDFSYCFTSCRFIFVDPNMFSSCQSIINLDYCFYKANIGNGPTTDPWANAPELWLTHASASHVGCFEDCTHAKNYADIPSDWK